MVATASEIFEEQLDLRMRASSILIANDYNYIPGERQPENWWLMRSPNAAGFCKKVKDALVMLDLFTNWVYRFQKNTLGVWTLLTMCRFQAWSKERLDEISGIAFRGGGCTKNMNTMIVSGGTPDSINTIFTHEVGHTLGARHTFFYAYLPKGGGYGIMDYAAGQKWKSLVQFHEVHKDNMCDLITATAFGWFASSQGVVKMRRNFCYEDGRYVIRFTIHEGSDLMDADGAANFSDPYVEVVTSDGATDESPDTKWGANPSFDDYQYTAYISDLDTFVITLKVWDDDDFSKDDFMGEAVISPGKLDKSGYQGWLPLYVKNEPQIDDCILRGYIFQGSVNISGTSVMNQKTLQVHTGSSFPAQTWSDCSYWCLAMKKCTHWTWHEGVNRCQVKADAGSGVQQRSMKISGTRRCLLDNMELAGELRVSVDWLKDH